MDAANARNLSWAEAIALYTRGRVLAMLFLGFSAGLPLPLTGFTLRQWFSEADLQLSAIGFTAWIGLAYAFKFVWSPVVDRMTMPFFGARLGHRRGWMLPVQIGLMLAIAAMALADPRSAPLHAAAIAVVVAFLSATQDIVIDAYRIESLKNEEQGAGLAAYIWGYRVALLAATSGALLLVREFETGWAGVYVAMGALMAVGIGACLIVREPPAAGPTRAPAAGPGEWFQGAVLRPFADFAKRDGWIWILAFVALFKLGEALAGIMTPPLYRSLGYSREQVAAIGSGFGLFATLAGVGVGGILVAKLGVGRALIGTGVLQMASNLMYVALVHAGGDITMLWLQVGIENFTDGLADAAFVAYLSRLTNVAFTATQYALLSSLAAVPLRMLGGFSGVLAQWLGWTEFFLLTTAAALPGMAIMIWLLRRYPPPDRVGAEPAQAERAGAGDG
ncbi:MAG: MFS transporter [Azospirillum sp.]|nr:MFS transporter [Azospirillum sp.]MCZ8121867.1 MFS transporter [Magnetospirillum sp.]